MPLIEVEAKYRVDDVDALRRQLEALGAAASDAVRHADEYFAHPARDFAATNEAFRIRSIADENRLTYKGPLLDATTKSREEIEVVFASGGDVRESMRRMLAALGFRSVLVVEKQRQPYRLNMDALTFEVCLDHVPELGDFVELETVADESAWENARDMLVELAENLTLSNSERRSYLELLLEVRDSTQR